MTAAIHGWDPYSWISIDGDYLRIACDMCNTENKAVQGKLVRRHGYAAPECRCYGTKSSEEMAGHIGFDRLARNQFIRGRYCTRCQRD